MATDYDIDEEDQDVMPAPLVEAPRLANWENLPALGPEEPEWSNRVENGRQIFRVETPALSPYGPTLQAEADPILHDIYKRGGFALGEQVRAASERMEGKYGWDADTRALVNQGVDEATARAQTFPRWATKLIPAKDYSKVYPPQPVFTPPANGAPGYFSRGRVQIVKPEVPPPTSITAIPVLAPDGTPIPNKVAIPGAGGGVHIETVKPTEVSASDTVLSGQARRLQKDLESATTDEEKLNIQAKLDVVKAQLDKRIAPNAPRAVPVVTPEVPKSRVLGVPIPFTGSPARTNFALPTPGIVAPPSELPLTKAAVRSVAPPEPKAAVRPFPRSKADAVKGELYQTRLGPMIWDGEQFIQP